MQLICILIIQFCFVENHAGIKWKSENVLFEIKHLLVVGFTRFFNCTILASTERKYNTCVEDAYIIFILWIYDV